jgi:dihydrofolate reductase
MAQVIGSVSMSLDGYVAGPNARPGSPLDDDGRLHRWIVSPAEADRRVLEAWDIAAGAVIVGRRMFDEGEGPWGEDPPWHVPVVVVTHLGVAR